MSKADEYRAKIEYCGKMAAKATAPMAREEWLQQATNWRALASLSRRAAADMSDPTHEKQIEVMGEIWESIASRLSKANDKA